MYYETINEINLVDSSNDSIKNQKIIFTGVLKRIQASERSINLRTSEVWGRFAFPEAGIPFVLFTAPLDENLSKENSLRLIKTSEVVKVREVNESTVQFSTLNSVYLISDIQKISNANLN